MNIVNNSLQDENGNILFLSEEEYTKMIRGINGLPRNLFEVIEIPFQQDEMAIFQRLVDKDEYESLKSRNIKLIKEKVWEKYLHENHITETSIAI